MGRYRGKELRKGRHSESGRAYLLTTVTHSRRPLFRDWRIERVLVAELRDATEHQLVDTLAWVIMPDHLHWLAVLRVTTLDAFMLRVKSRSAIAVNGLLGTTGRVGQKGYHDHAIREEEDIRCVARYIVSQPAPCRPRRTRGGLPIVGCDLAVKRGSPASGLLRECVRRQASQ